MEFEKSKIISFAFDLDGTLVDTENHKAESHKESIEYFGGQMGLHAYYDLIGNSFEYVFQKLKSDLPINVTEYKNVFNKKYLEKLNNITLTRGAIDLLEKIYFQKIKIALVTSSEKWMMDFILQRLEIDKYFEIKISGDDVINNKPNAEPYLKAIEFLNTTRTYVFEDSKAGLTSAIKAGAIVFGIKNKNNKLKDLQLAKQIFKNFSEFDLDEIMKSTK